MNTLSIKLKMTIHGINVNLYHVLEKLQGMYKHYFSVLNLENNSVKDIDWQTIKEWRSLSGLSDNIVNDALLEAKIYEIEKWKQNVFEPVKYVGQQTVPSRWVITE